MSGSDEKDPERRDDIPDEERAVEAADGLLAGQGEAPADRLADGPGNADLNGPGVVEKATGQSEREHITSLYK